MRVAGEAVVTHAAYLSALEIWHYKALDTFIFFTFTFTLVLVVQHPLKEVYTP